MVNNWDSLERLLFTVIINEKRIPNGLSGEGVNGFVYIASPRNYKEADIYKVGKSTNLRDRMRTLSTGSPEPFKLYMVIKTYNERMCERFMHYLFQENIYSSNADNEWFVLEEEDFDKVRSCIPDRIIFDDEDGLTVGEYISDGGEYKACNKIPPKPCVKCLGLTKADDHLHYSCWNYEGLFDKDTWDSNALQHPCESLSDDDHISAKLARSYGL